MRYRLRTMLILMAVGPPLLAIAVIEPDAIAVIVVAVWAIVGVLAFGCSVAFLLHLSIAGAWGLAERISGKR